MIGPSVHVLLERVTHFFPIWPEILPLAAKAVSQVGNSLRGCLLYICLVELRRQKLGEAMLGTAVPWDTPTRYTAMHRGRLP